MNFRQTQFHIVLCCDYVQKEVSRPPPTMFQHIYIRAIDLFDTNDENNISLYMYVRMYVSICTYTCSIWNVSYCHIYEQDLQIYKHGMALISPHSIYL